jgi:hypothetical protein
MRADVTGAMAKTGFTSVDEYIASQPEAVQGILVRVRSAIRDARSVMSTGLSADHPEAPGGNRTHDAGTVGRPDVREFSEQVTVGRNSDARQLPICEDRQEVSASIIGERTAVVRIRCLTRGLVK